MGLQGRSLQGLSDDALLGGAIGSSQAAAAAVLVHCAASEDSQDICNGCMVNTCFLLLQEDHPTALSPA